MTSGRRSTGRSVGSTPRMEDVAARAGVSLGTVSNALNHPEIVSPATLQRVHDAVESLNFVRNDAARSLAARVGNTVGLVLVDLANSLFVDISRGAEQRLHAHAKSLLIADSDVDLARQDRNLGLFDEARVAGIILAPLDASLSQARAVRRHGREVVLVNYSARGFCGVTVDEVHGGYLATRHLLETGRRRLLFSGGPLTLRAVADRWSGAQQAVEEWGDGARLEHRVTASLSVREGGAVADELTSRSSRRRPDGVIAAADTLAIGVVQQLTARGAAVPNDVAVTGYDDNHLASDSSLPITSVRQPGHEMGSTAAELLLAEVAASGTHRHRTVVLKPHLIVRRSTDPAAVVG